MTETQSSKRKDVALIVTLPDAEFQSSSKVEAAFRRFLCPHLSESNPLQQKRNPTRLGSNIRPELLISEG